MYDRLSLKIKEYLVDAQKFAYNKNKFVIGTELIVLMMLRNKDSLVSFLFREFDIEVSEYTSILNTLEIIRSNKSEGVSFTMKLKQIIKDSSEFATEQNSKFVFDEHLFYQIILSNNIATTILKRMDVDIDLFMEEINDIYNWNTIKKGTIGNDCLKSITNHIKEKEEVTFVGRGKYINRLRCVLLKKTKNNPLLVGNAGVGKTALIYGLAKKFLQDEEFKKYHLYSLNLGGVISGTKYRGDFEKKLLDSMEYIKSEQHAILFIDEIHNLVGAGSSEGSMDAANILKPMLTEEDISVIGATTIAEYNKYFVKDKALTRRFQPIFIEEPSVLETIEIVKGITSDFVNYYNITVTNEVVEYLVEEANNYITKRSFPDKAIDVLDEAFVLAFTNKEEKLSIKEVDNAINNILGIQIKKELVLSEKYPEINTYVLRFRYAVYPKRNIMNVLYKGLNVTPFLEELYSIFDLNQEMVLQLNLSHFKETHSFTSLVGSPKGYVGYESGGILLNHVNNYPISIIVVKEYHPSVYAVKKLFDDILTNYTYLDSLGRVVTFYHTIFIFMDQKSNKNSVGFLEKETKNHTYPVDIVIEEQEEEIHFKSVLFKRYLQKLKIDGYDICISDEMFIDDKYIHTFEQFVVQEIIGKEVGKYNVRYCEKNAVWVFKI